jgi:tRNA pseudouridine55 synthase
MKPKLKRNPIHGWVNLNKPLGITSADAVFQVKRLIHPSKIGHAGTLDPLATGVLPLALGEGTKCVNLLMDAKKIYDFSITFGERRCSDDAEGAVVATSSHMPSEPEIRAILPQFTGPIMQLPPIYSAIKLAGRRAYDMARAGEEVVLATRPVTIYELEVVRVQNLESSESLLDSGLSILTTPCVAHFRAKVSKGTYIRSLGRDIAQSLGSEGYISRLHRAAVGPFTDANAISLDFLAESVHKAPALGEITSWLTPLLRALDDIPALTLSSGQLHQLRHGQRVTLTKPYPDTPQIVVVDGNEMAGMARVEGNQVISTRLLVL